MAYDYAPRADGSQLQHSDVASSSPSRSIRFPEVAVPDHAAVNFERTDFLRRVGYGNPVDTVSAPVKSIDLSLSLFQGSWSRCTNDSHRVCRQMSTVAFFEDLCAKQWPLTPDDRVRAHVVSFAGRGVWCARDTDAAATATPSAARVIVPPALVADVVALAHVDGRTGEHCSVANMLMQLECAGVFVAHAMDACARAVAHCAACRVRAFAPPASQARAAPDDDLGALTDANTGLDADADADTWFLQMLGPLPSSEGGARFVFVAICVAASGAHLFSAADASSVACVEALDALLTVVPSAVRLLCVHGRVLAHERVCAHACARERRVEVISAAASRLWMPFVRIVFAALCEAGGGRVSGGWRHALPLARERVESAMRATTATMRTKVRSPNSIGHATTMSCYVADTEPARLRPAPIALVHVGALATPVAWLLSQKHVFRDVHAPGDIVEV